RPAERAGRTGQCRDHARLRAPPARDEHAGGPSAQAQRAGAEIRLPVQGRLRRSPALDGASRNATPADRLPGSLRSQFVTSNLRALRELLSALGAEPGAALDLGAAAPALLLFLGGRAALGAELGAAGLGAAGLADGAGDLAHLPALHPVHLLGLFERLL